MLDIIRAAGWPIIPLLFASVIAVALIVERAISLRRKQIVPEGLLERLVAELRQNVISDEFIKKVSNHSPLGRVLAAGLSHAKSPREVMKESIEEAGGAVAHELEKYLTTLGTIATVTPLMGLFGTVVGMIELFGANNPATGGADPTALAHGISIALYNTGFGLLIAIPSLIAHRHYRALVDSLVVDMEQQAVKLVEVIHGERRVK